MKNAFKTIAIILFVLTTLMACKKKTEDSPLDFTIDDQKLTECPQGTACSFLYANNASMIERGLTLTKGQSRIFWVRSQGDGRTSWLYMQAPMQGDKFQLNDADVQAGRVKYISSCPACFGVELVAIRGTVKGVKVASNNSSPEKWLIEANVELSVEGGTKAINTLYVKQYYTAALQ